LAQAGRISYDNSLCLANLALVRAVVETPPASQAASTLYASLGGQCQKMQKTKELIEPITISKNGARSLQSRKSGQNKKNIYK